MDNDFKKLKSLEKPEVVYRGEGVNKYMKSTVAHYDDIASKNIGDIIIDPGYSYSSFNPVVARSFLGDEMQKGIFYKINVPAGARVSCCKNSAQAETHLLEFR